MIKQIYLSSIDVYCFDTETNGGGKNDEISSKRTDSRDNVVSTGTSCWHEIRNCFCYFL